MSPEQLEFILTQYLDGTLPAEEAGALERALESDPRAQALRDEHERLTALLRSQALPEMDWDEVARDLSAVVTGNVDEQTRAEDQRLNAILKAATPLPELQWDELSRRISAAVDDEMAGASAEDQAFDAMLRSTPKPAVKWDRLADHLSNVIAAEAEAGAQQADERPAVIGRIGWVRTASRLAMAACVVLAVGLGIRFYMKAPSAVVPDTRGQVVVFVDTPAVEKSNGTAVAEISIGPSKQYVASSDSDMYRVGVASRSPVVIAAPVAPEDEGDRSVGLGFE
jgi:negative regulator of sigma E activity